ncbi:MAG: hypothetical protein ABDH91_06855 [Bacteroidia bacterium]
MRNPSLAVIGLLGLVWAQRSQLPPLRVYRLKDLPPAIQEKLLNPEIRRRFFYLPPEVGGGMPMARTANGADFFPRIPGHLDADTLRPGRRATEQNIPDPQSGDTVLAVVHSSQTDTTIPPDVKYKPYFDSLNIRGSYGFGFNLLEKGEEYDLDGDGQNDLADYNGNAWANRFDIPDSALPFYVVGLGFHLYNNFGLVEGGVLDCDLSTTPEGSPGYSNNNRLYEIFAQLRTARLDTAPRPDTLVRLIGGRQETTLVPRIYTYPDSILYQIGWPARQLRVGWRGSTRDQCWGSDMGTIDWRKNMAVAYFDLPYRINPGDTFYAVVASELYNPDLDIVRDTLYLRLGPIYPWNSPNIPKWARFWRRGVKRDTLRALAPKPEGVSMWNYLWRLIEGGQEKEFVGEGWVSVSWTIFSQTNDTLVILRSYHIGIYPVIAFSPSYQPPYQPDYTPPAAGGTGIAIRWGDQGFGLPYPNPATDCVHLLLDTPTPTTASFVLMKPTGEIVYEWERSVGAGQQQVTLDVGHIAAGPYLLHASTPYGTTAFQLYILH